MFLGPGNDGFAHYFRGTRAENIAGDDVVIVIIIILDGDDFNRPAPGTGHFGGPLRHMMGYG